MKHHWWVDSLAPWPNGWHCLACPCDYDIPYNSKNTELEGYHRFCKEIDEIQLINNMIIDLYG